MRGERGLVRGAARAHDETALARRARHTRRQRRRAAADRDLRADVIRDGDLGIEEHGMVGIRARRRQPDHLDRPGGQLEPELTCRILEHRAQLDELGDQRSQAAIGREALGGEGDSHPCPRRQVGGRVVANMHVGVRVIARGGEEPGLDRAPVTDSLDPARALGEPHVAQAAAEQTAPASGFRQLTEDAKPPLHRVRVDADAVIGAGDLEAPARQRGRVQRAHLRAPGGDERRIRRAEAQLDPPAAAPAGRDGRVRVGHELGPDLHEIDTALGEVLAKVPAAHGADADCRVRQHARANVADGRDAETGWERAMQHAA